jgi:hypothetical protein
MATSVRGSLAGSSSFIEAYDLEDAALYTSIALHMKSPRQMTDVLYRLAAFFSAFKPQTVCRGPLLKTLSRLHHTRASATYVAAWQLKSCQVSQI